MRFARFRNRIEAISGMRVFLAARKGLVLTLPLIAVGAFAIVFNNLPIPAYQNMMRILFGESWTLFGEYIHQGSFSVIAVALTMTIGFSYAELEPPGDGSFESSPIITAIVSLMCFFVLTYMENDAIPLRYLGKTAVFIAMLNAIVSAKVFHSISKVKIFKLGMVTDAGELNTKAAFSSMFPAILTVGIFALIRIALGALNIRSVHDLLYQIAQESSKHMSSSLASALVFVLLVHLMWFLGLHGTNILEPVVQSLFVPMLAANQELASLGITPKYILTKEFFDVFVFLGGCGATLCMLAALLIWSKSRSNRNISIMSLIPSIFNINETIVFGIPIIFNFYFFIPFIIVPVILTIVTYTAMSTGLVPVVTQSVEWTTPILLSGYAATGSLAGTVLQIVNFAIGIAVYLPFIRYCDSQDEARNKKALKGLIASAVDRTGMASVGEFARRSDIIGGLAHQLAADLRYDMDQGRLWLEYQPKVRCSGEIVGVEALLRWKHPTYGMLPPPVTIALAEDFGMIHQLGAWIFRTSCLQLREWSEAGMDNFSIAVNVAPSQLDKRIILPYIRSIVEETGADPSRVEIEITEQTALTHAGDVLQIIKELKETGLKIAIDDFGMGRTSLIALKELEVDTIKLDGSVVEDIVSNSSSRDIVSSIVYFADRTNLLVIAEYVQSDEQRDALCNLGVKVHQGWFYSKSLLPEDFKKYYSVHSTWRNQDNCCMNPCGIGCVRSGNKGVPCKAAESRAGI